MKTILGGVFAGIVIAAAAVAQHASDIEKFLRVDERVCTGGQPSPEQLTALRQEGVRTILNLREAEEHNAGEEQAAARRAGLAYVNIPVCTSEPRREQVDAFLAALEDPEIYPVFIHCGTGNRVGAFWMIRRMLVDGWSAAAAEEEARRIGLTSPKLREFALAEAAERSKRSSPSSAPGP